jgi:hypothetical protein
MVKLAPVIVTEALVDSVLLTVIDAVDELWIVLSSKSYAVGFTVMLIEIPFGS